jgi:hypothetical protein
MPESSQLSAEAMASFAMATTAAGNTTIDSVLSYRNDNLNEGDGKIY